MNNLDALLFTGKCLTLGQSPDNIPEIKKKIQSGTVDWEQIVWISTRHLVFSALHLQLQRAGLLNEIPSDLVEYMEELTCLNRIRNKEILDQAVQINKLLEQNGITPVFLKGTAHLSDGLYTDIGERMAGDIDFLVRSDLVLKTAEILKAGGYEPMSDPDNGNWRHWKHYPRMIHPEWIAGVEIHQHILKPPYFKILQGHTVIHNSRKSYSSESTLIVPSSAHQIIHNILNMQINDSGYYLGLISLRQMYDLSLLSARMNPYHVISESGKSFHRMNTNLAITNKILNYPTNISYKKDWQSALFCLRVLANINHSRWYGISKYILYMSDIAVKSISDKGLRQIVIKSLLDPGWYRRHIRKHYRSN